MQKSKPGQHPSLFAILVVKGAVLAGMAGIAAGKILGTISALPVTAAAIGYSMGGWASAVTGLMLGAAANFWPLRKNTTITQPATPDSPALETHETVRLCDYAGKACAVTGGITGAFVGATVGAGLAGIVIMGEARQGLVNGEMPQDPNTRRKGRDDGPFFH